MHTVSIEVLTLIVAGIAAIAGPLATWVVGQRTHQATLEATRQQVRAAVVSTNRQKWIDALRDEIAEFLAQDDLLKTTLNDAEPDHGAKRASSSRMVRLFHQLQLRLNPDEADHQRILALADTHAGGTPGRNLSREEIEELTNLSQAVLKREWERVKSGD